AEGTQSGPPDRNDGKQRSERRRQPGSKFADAKKAHCDSGSPVIQHRLFKPWRAPQPGGNPIMRLGHRASDCGVTGLVGANEAKRAQSAEQAHVENQKSKRNAPEWNLKVAFFSGARADWSRG